MTNSFSLSRLATMSRKGVHCNSNEEYYHESLHRGSNVVRSFPESTSRETNPVQAYMQERYQIRGICLRCGHSRSGRQFKESDNPLDLIICSRRYPVAQRDEISCALFKRLIVELIGFNKTIIEINNYHPSPRLEAFPSTNAIELHCESSLANRFELPSYSDNQLAHKLVSQDIDTTDEEPPQVNMKSKPHTK